MIICFYIFYILHMCFIYRCSFLINPRLGFLLFALSSSPRLCFWRPLIHGSVLIMGLSLHLQAQWGSEPYSDSDMPNEPAQTPNSKPSRALRAVQLRWTLSIQAQQWNACKASIFAWRLWARRNSAAIGRRALKRPGFVIKVPISWSLAVEQFPWKLAKTHQSAVALCLIITTLRRHRVRKHSYYILTVRVISWKPARRNLRWNSIAYDELELLYPNDFGDMWSHVRAHTNAITITFHLDVILLVSPWVLHNIYHFDCRINVCI